MARFSFKIKRTDEASAEHQSLISVSTLPRTVAEVVEVLPSSQSSPGEPQRAEDGSPGIQPDLSPVPVPAQQPPALDPVEAPMSMETHNTASPAYPFVTADMDIEMIDKLHPVSNGSTPAGSAPVPSNGANGGHGDPVAMAQELAGAVQDMVRRLHDLEARRQQLEERLQRQEETMRTTDTLKQALKESAGVSMSEDEMASLKRVLQNLAQDPNHIMVLASVAQNAPQLLAVVNSYERMQSALQARDPS